LLREAYVRAALRGLRSSCECPPWRASALSWSADWRYLPHGRYCRHGEETGTAAADMLGHPPRRLQLLVSRNKFAASAVSQPSAPPRPFRGGFSPASRRSLRPAF